MTQCSDPFFGGREFLHVDDVAAACEFVMNLAPDRYRSVVRPRCSHLNVGAGTDVSIGELAQMIATLTGFDGRIEFDSGKPDGTPQKLLDVSKMSGLGWQAAISLHDGIKETYKWLMLHWDEVVQRD